MFCKIGNLEILNAEAINKKYSTLHRNPAVTKSSSVWTATTVSVSAPKIPKDPVSWKHVSKKHTLAGASFKALLKSVFKTGPVCDFSKFKALCMKVPHPITLPMLDKVQIANKQMNLFSQFYLKLKFGWCLAVGIIIFILCFVESLQLKKATIKFNFRQM